MADDLNIQIGATITDLQKALDKAQADIDKFASNTEKRLNSLVKTGEKMKNIGSSMSKFVSLPLAALGGVAVKTAAEFERLNVALVTTFKGNEKAAKAAFDQIVEFAAKTPFQVEQVTNAFIKLKNMGLDPSEKALTSYGNTASAMGKSLDQMVEAVADAATGEFERLKEFGIKASKQGDRVSFTFRGITTEVKNSSEAIQGYLMNIGETDFAGGMEAQSKTFLGRISTLKDNVALFGNEIGKILLEYINPMVDMLAKLTERFKNLSPETKKMIVIVGALVAAIGPLLLALGAIVSIAPAIGTAITIMTGPIGILIVALGALAAAIVMNWDSIKKGLVDTANYFIDLYNESVLVRMGIESVILYFKNLYEAAKFLITATYKILSQVGARIADVFKRIGNLVLGIVTFDKAKIKQAMSGFIDGVKSGFSGLFDEVNKDYKAYLDTFEKNTNEAVARIEGKRPKLKIQIETSTGESSELGSDSSGGGIGETIKRQLATVPPFIAEMGLQISEQAKVISDSLNSAVSIDPATMEQSTQTLTNFKNIALDITQEIANSFSNMAESIGYAFANGDNAAKVGGAAILAGIGGILVKFGQLVLATGLASEAFKAAILNPFGGGIGAIIAGGALIAIGGAVKAFSKNLGSSGSTGGGTNPEFNGGAGSGTPYGSSNVNGSSSSNSLQNVVFEIQGTKLVGVISNTLNRNKSLNGTLSIN